MANPTTYFAWVMPNSADLVTDLPADFAVFGQGVDTSMSQLLGGTTGQVLAKTSATNMAFTWTTPQVGDITGVTAGTGISGGGTSGTVTVTNDMATTITTNGDLLYGTGSGTYTRRAIGSTSQVLTVAGGIPTWATPAASASGLTLIETNTFSASSAVNINNVFTSTYTNYKIILLENGSANTAINFRMRAAGTNNTASNYAWGLAGIQYTGQSAYNESINGSLQTSFKIGATGGDKECSWSADILQPQATAITSYNGIRLHPDATAPNAYGYTTTGFLSVTTSYDGISIFPSSGTITGSYFIYGYQKTV